MQQYKGGDSKGGFFISRVFRWAAVGWLAVFGACLASPVGASAATNAGGAIIQNTTWTVAASPYVIQEDITIPSGITLTLEAGTIVKFGQNINVNVNGSFVTKGSANGTVYLTSFLDDAVGGDTNGDGVSSQPAPRDWRGVRFNVGSTGNIAGTVIEYAGNNTAFGSSQAGIYNLGGTMSISSSSLTKNNAYGIYQKSGSLNCSYCTIDHHTRYGVYLVGGTMTVDNSFVHDNASYGLYIDTMNTLTLSNTVFANNQAAVLAPSLANVTHSGNRAYGGSLNGFVVGGSIAADQTWSRDMMPYIILQLTINAGKTLTISPGSVIKFDPSGTVGLTVDGTLRAVATDTDRIFFTSIKDDGVGGDTNGDGLTSSAVPGDWREMRFNAGSTGVLTSAVVRYAGNLIGTGSSGSGIFNNGGAVVLEHVQIDHNKQYGLKQQSGSAIVTSSEINNHSNRGILVNGGTLSMSQSRLHDNTLYALDNETSVSIDARNNWWGSDTGPNVIANPSGLGNSFLGNVQFDPWIGKALPNHRPTLSFVANESGYTADGVEPDMSFLPAQPVFKIVYTDQDGDEPVFVNLVVDNINYPMTFVTGTPITGEIFSFRPATGTFSKGIGHYHFGSNDGKANTLWSYAELVFTIKHEPVILVPGILGTELKQGSDTLWMNLGRMLVDSGDAFLDQLALNSDGSPSVVNVIPGDIIREQSYLLGSVRMWSTLIDEFKREGYQEGDDLFVLPYDWRLSNRDSATKLAQKITFVIGATQSPRVNLVAHSMGGLVVKQYLATGGANRVDKVVLVGVPELGAPKALKALLYGDTFGIPLILNQLEMKKISANMASVYELLPSAAYVARSGSYFADATNGGDFNDLQTKQFLLNHGGNVNLLSDATTFHTNLDTFSGGPEIYVINGCDTPTIGKITVRNRTAQDTEYNIGEVAGDGTVPLASALAIPTTNDHRYYVSGAEHATMPSQDGIRQLIVRMIVSRPLAGTLGANITTNASACSLKKGKLISVHSPVDLHVYDQNNQHLGLGANGAIEEQIPGAHYEDIGANKFVFVPEDAGQTYAVKLAATATGTFSLNVATLDAGVEQQNVYYTDVPITPKSTGQMTINDHSADTVLQFDQVGSGQSIPLQASAVLTGVQDTDAAPPSTTISASGVRANGWSATPVRVTLVATDTLAGVFKTEYSSDNGVTWQIYGSPFTINSPGTSTIWYRSVDRAGNREQPQQFSFMIDQTPPEASVEFDPRTKDIVVTGHDNFGLVSVVDANSKVMVYDQAGNTLELIFNERNRKKQLAATLVSMSYNTNGATVTPNRFVFTWKTDKSGRLVKLEQSVMAKDVFRVQAVYDVHRNQTVVRETNQNGKFRRSTVTGLVILKVMTKQGSIGYRF